MLLFIASPPGKGVYWISYLLLILSIPFLVAVVLILSYRLFPFIGIPLPIFINLLVQGFVWISQAKSCTLRFDLEESSLVITIQRTFLYALFCCCCGPKIKQTVLSLDNISRLFYKPACCASHLLFVVVTKDSKVISPSAHFNADELTDAIDTINQYLSSLHPEEFDRAASVYLSTLHTKDQRTLISVISQINSHTHSHSANTGLGQPASSSTEMAPLPPASDSYATVYPPVPYSYDSPDGYPVSPSI